MEELRRITNHWRALWNLGFRPNLLRQGGTWCLYQIRYHEIPKCQEKLRLLAPLIKENELDRILAGMCHNFLVSQLFTESSHELNELRLMSNLVYQHFPELALTKKWPRPEEIEEELANFVPNKKFPFASSQELDQQQTLCEQLKDELTLVNEWRGYFAEQNQNSKNISHLLAPTSLLPKDCWLFRLPNLPPEQATRESIMEAFLGPVGNYPFDENIRLKTEILMARASFQARLYLVHEDVHYPRRLTIWVYASLVTDDHDLFQFVINEYLGVFEGCRDKLRQLEMLIDETCSLEGHESPILHSFYWELLVDLLQEVTRFPAEDPFRLEGQLMLVKMMVHRASLIQLQKFSWHWLDPGIKEKLTGAKEDPLMQLLLGLPVHPLALPHLLPRLANLDFTRKRVILREHGSRLLELISGDALLRELHSGRKTHSSAMNKFLEQCQLLVDENPLLIINLTDQITVPSTSSELLELGPGHLYMLALIREDCRSMLESLPGKFELDQVPFQILRKLKLFRGQDCLERFSELYKLRHYCFKEVNRLWFLGQIFKVARLAVGSIPILGSEQEWPSLLHTYLNRWPLMMQALEKMRQAEPASWMEILQDCREGLSWPQKQQAFRAEHTIFVHNTKEVFKLSYFKEEKKEGKVTSAEWLELLPHLLLNEPLSLGTLCQLTNNFGLLDLTQDPPRVFTEGELRRRQLAVRTFCQWDCYWFALTSLVTHGFLEFPLNFLPSCSIKRERRRQRLLGDGLYKEKTLRVSNVIRFFRFFHQLEHPHLQMELCSVLYGRQGPSFFMSHVIRHHLASCLDQKVPSDF